MVNFYELLGALGYSKDNLDKRFRIYENAAKGGTLICNRNWNEDIDIDICGSRGEGLESSFESDLDVLFIQRSVKCFESHLNLPERLKFPLIFSLDLENVPDGYTKLRFISMQSTDDSKNSGFLRNVRDALEYRNGNYYLSNERTLTTAIEYRHKNNNESWFKNHIEFDEIAGPSRPFRFKVPVLGGYIDADFVQAFPCHFPSLVEAWCTRRRRFDWPSEALIEEVKGLDVFVVPVGQKGSRDKALQWRVSMTLAERALVRSFNDSQIKLYKAVKMIVKQELKPICNDISSYLVKNILFWVFEETKVSDITENNFDCIFIKILKYFKDCIRRRKVQCYTIPFRNLLGRRFTENENRELTRQLDIIISEGIFTLLRCPLMINLAVYSKLSIVSLLIEKVADRILLSLAALPPSVGNILEQTLFNAKSQEEVLTLYITIVLPLIQETNPFGYFDLIKSMTNEQVCCLLFMDKHFDVLRQK